MHTIRSWLTDWVGRILPNSQAVSFALLLVVGCVAVVSLGRILMPVFAAGIIAYLLEALVVMGMRRKLPRLISVIVVYIFFLTLLVIIIVGLLPLLYKQTEQLIGQIPAMVNSGQSLVMQLPEKYPHFITQDQINEIMGSVRQELVTSGQTMLGYSYASIVSVITLTIYLVLVPLLVFFFMKDKDQIMDWVSQYLPKDSNLSSRVWREVDAQIGNYVRGKFFEIGVLLVASYVTFSVMSLNYSLLLAVLMGLSVIIPYVGATLVTFPVMIVAFFQWGVSDDFWYLMLAYGIIQALDGVVLVPLLFSEVVNLHPVGIMVAILFFGGIWGFWGVFFAIPLATLVQAVLTAWPRLGEADGDIEPVR
ncbi:MAG: AI-2E family transporter [Methylococcaceae bacterium]|nr:AI-2E family transporter [Methylococcaceae bacterium]